MTVTERTFRSSADVVFNALVHAEGYPRWLVGAQFVRTDPAWPAPGSSFHHRVGFGPLGLNDRTTVRELEPGRRLRLKVRARPVLEADVEFVVTPVGTGSGAGSSLRMEERPVGLFRFAAPVFAPLVKARNERSLQRLADVVDGSKSA
jgi:uncharacterized protein YndB with AHSA1/START domain